MTNARVEAWADTLFAEKAEKHPGGLKLVPGQSALGQWQLVALGHLDYQEPNGYLLPTRGLPVPAATQGCDKAAVGLRSQMYWLICQPISTPIE